MKELKERMEEVTDEYGQLHEQGKKLCELNYEGGSIDGCSCAMAGLTDEVTLLAQQYAIEELEAVMKKFYQQMPADLFEASAIVTNQIQAIKEKTSEG